MIYAFNDVELVDSEPSDDDFDAVEEAPEEQDIMITSPITNCINVYLICNRERDRVSV